MEYVQLQFLYSIERINNNQSINVVFPNILLQNIITIHKRNETKRNDVLHIYRGRIYINSPLLSQTYL